MVGVQALGIHGADRMYCRMDSGSLSAVAVRHPDQYGSANRRILRMANHLVPVWSNEVPPVSNNQLRIALPDMRHVSNEQVPRALNDQERIRDED